MLLCDRISKGINMFDYSFNVYADQVKAAAQYQLWVIDTQLRLDNCETEEELQAEKKAIQVEINTLIVSEKDKQLRLLQAILSFRPDVVDLLIQYDSYNTSLHPSLIVFAAKRGYKKTVMYLQIMVVSVRINLLLSLTALRNYH